MLKIDHGVEYVVIFKENIDYYDVIPDLEKMFRRRFNIENGRRLILIKTSDTYKRVMNSQYYYENEKRWFQCRNPFFRMLSSNPTQEDIISLYGEEEEIVNFVILKYNGKIEKHGWGEVLRYND